MRILLAAHAFFPESHAGTETVTLHMAHHLKESGHEVAVLAPHPSYVSPQIAQAIIEQESYEGISIYRILRPMPKADFRSQYLHSLKDESLIPLYLDLLESFQPDVVHIMHLMRLSGSLVEAAKAYGASLIYTPTDFWPVCPTYQLLNWKGENCEVHTAEDCKRCFVAESLRAESLKPSELKARIEAPDFNQRYPGLTEFESVLKERNDYFKTLFDWFDLAVPANEFMKKTLSAGKFIDGTEPVIGFGAPVRKIAPIAEKSREKDAKIRVGFCGTVRYSKGLHVLIEAIEKYTDPETRLEFELFGFVLEKPYFADLENRWKRFSNVTFSGTFASSRTDQVVRGFDLLVLPSVWHENTPLIAYTALHNRTPLLCSATEGLVEIVKKQRGGRLFSSGNSDELAALLTAVAHDPTLVEAWSKEIIAVNTSRDFAQAYLALYEGYRELESGEESSRLAKPARQSSQRAGDLNSQDI